jgi:hypothetical protein
MFSFCQSANHRVQQSAEYSFGSCDGAGVPKKIAVSDGENDDKRWDRVPSALFSIPSGELT